MRIRLLRSLQTPHTKYFVGNIINYSKGLAMKLIEKGRAEKYKGEYPPKKKMKTDFFKPKNNGNN
jgi:hypothetical protein